MYNMVLQNKGLECAFSMKKKSLLALLIAAVMLLSGCSLVLRDSAVDELQTIIEVNGEIINKRDFMDAYSYYLSMEQYYAQIYAQLGMSYTVDEQEVLNDTVSTLMTDLVLRQKLRELGLDVLSAEDEAALDAEAQEDYQGHLDEVRENYFADSELTGDALDEAVAAYAENTGYTLDAIRNNLKNTKLSDRLRAYVTDPVTIGDDELQAALDEKIEAEKTSYASDLAAYGAAANKGTFTYYIPAGYRSVKLIEVAKPAAEEAADGAAEEEAKKPVEALAEAEALLQRLNDGEAIDALGVEAASYAVCMDSTDVDTAVVAAVFALTEKGAYTGIVETDAAFVIAQYADDVAERSATLEETRDLLYDDTLKAAQDSAYNDAVNAWVEAADIRIYGDRLN